MKIFDQFGNPIGTLGQGNPLGCLLVLGIPLAAIAVALETWYVWLFFFIIWVSIKILVRMNPGVPKWLFKVIVSLGIFVAILAIILYPTTNLDAYPREVQFALGAGLILWPWIALIWVSWPESESSTYHEDTDVAQGSSSINRMVILTILILIAIGILLNLSTLQGLFEQLRNLVLHLLT